MPSPPWLAAAAASPDRTERSSAPDPSSPSSAAGPILELVESFPVETRLDHPQLPEAHDIWREMIDSATHTLAFAEFYASNAPNSRLEPIVRAIESAASRGVQVRFLAEQKFYATYPRTLDRLDSRPGIEVRRFDVASLMGGVLHAKYFIVDGREAYLGSQNFDWRALTHIQELGVRIRESATVRALGDLFEADWAWAGGAPPENRIARSAGAYRFPATVTTRADTLQVTPVFSPRGWLPDDSLWDLPRLVGMIDEAQESVRVQLLTYRTVGRDGRFFDQLESALRRAAARGVEVQLLLAHWSKRASTIPGLQSLQVLPGITVKLVTIPAWSGGFIPYARVVHAKYMVVDGQRAWVGTSNWERDYFYHSRNVGLLVTGESFAALLEDYFRNGWHSPYAERVDPCAAYPVPRIGE
jgi:phosphatidylserine/phosphatidylglycerophosphate/cardiolipin synthase-like enzyme